MMCHNNLFLFINDLKSNTYNAKIATPYRYIKRIFTVFYYFINR